MELQEGSPMPRSFLKLLSEQWSSNISAPRWLSNRWRMKHKTEGSHSQHPAPSQFSSSRGLVTTTPHLTFKTQDRGSSELEKTQCRCLFVLVAFQMSGWVIFRFPYLFIINYLLWLILYWPVNIILTCEGLAAGSRTCGHGTGSCRYWCGWVKIHPWVPCEHHYTW